MLGTCFGNRGVSFIENKFNIVVCKNCGLTYINPQIEEKDLEEYYRSQNYRCRTGKFTLERKKLIDEFNFQRVYVNFLKKHLDPNNNPKVLDCGCGFGTFLHFLKEAGYEPEGMDPSAEVSARVKDFFNFSVHNCFIENNSLENKYNIVTEIGVIEHSFDPKNHLKAVNKILKKDGYIFLVTPNFPSLILNKGWNKYFKFVHTFYFSENTLSSILNQSGFEVKWVWKIPPIIKHANFLYPMNFTQSILCIIAQKTEKNSNNYFGDNPISLFELVNKEKKRAFPYYMAKKIYYSPLRFFLKPLMKAIKPKDPHTSKEFLNIS